VVNRSFKILPITAGTLGALILFSENATAEQAAKTKGICSLVPEKSSSRRDAKLDSTGMVTLEGDLNRSFHFGIIITDRACGDQFVRVAIPVPDEGNIWGEFQGFSKNYGNPGTHFSCTCSGRLRFIKRIPILTLDNAQVVEHVEQQ
jgi:hypothetical protein